MRVKTFYGISANKLEKVLQDWLDENPRIAIHHVAQSQDGTGWVTVTILYTGKLN